MSCPSGANEWRDYRQYYTSDCARRGYPAQEAHGRGTIDIDRTDSLVVYRMILVGREGSKRQVGADGHGGWEG